MKNSLKLISLAVFLISACTKMSEHQKDPSAGLNGGFEITQNGLPVNWLMYTTNTVPDSDFEISFDKITYEEGKQSLRFDVSKCNSFGEWRSPGFTNEFFDSEKFEGKGTYKLSLWVMNDGSTFKISGGGVSSHEGDMKTLVETDEQIEEWRLLEFSIDVPEDRWLRIQLNILQPGTFWIDDVRIERI